MKLRNKKTREVWNVWSFYDGNQTINLKYFNNDGQVNLEYNSLAELNEEWEDYNSAEPLIKDEKKRKSLQFFANLTECKTFEFQAFNNCFVHEFGDGVTYSIGFDNSDGLEKLEKYKSYTIEELCREKEE